MPRILLRKRPPPALERGAEPSRSQREVIVRAYSLVAPVLRRALPSEYAKNSQGRRHQEHSASCVIGG